MPRSIETAPRDGAQIWLHCRSGTELVTATGRRRSSVGSRTTRPRHDVTGWEPIEDQAAARVVALDREATGRVVQP